MLLTWVSLFQIFVSSLFICVFLLFHPPAPFCSQGSWTHPLILCPSLGSLVPSTPGYSAALHSQIHGYQAPLCLGSSTWLSPFLSCFLDVQFWGYFGFWGHISCSLPEDSPPCTEPVSMPETLWMASLHGLEATSFPVLSYKFSSVYTLHLCSIWA